MIERRAGRVILLDRQGRVLLFRGSDPARPQDGTWWFTPGGGLDPGETMQQAARREVREETGLELADDLGPVVLRRTAEFRFEGEEFQQYEEYFRVTVDGGPIDYSGWTETERRTVHTHRWWSAEELRATTETVYPERLLSLLPTP